MLAILSLIYGVMAGQTVKVPLIHLPRENLYHGLVYVGSNQDRLQVFFDTMQTETALNLKRADGEKIPSTYNVLDSETSAKVYDVSTGNRKGEHLQGKVFFGDGANVRLNGAYYTDSMCLAQTKEGMEGERTNKTGRLCVEN